MLFETKPISLRLSPPKPKQLQSVTSACQVPSECVPRSINYHYQTSLARSFHAPNYASNSTLAMIHTHSRNLSLAGPQKKTFIFTGASLFISFTLPGVLHNSVRNFTFNSAESLSRDEIAFPELSTRLWRRRIACAIVKSIVIHAHYDVKMVNPEVTS